MENFIEFMQFEYFISENILTVFYAFLAALIPVVSWYFLLWAIRRYVVVIKLYRAGKYSLIFSLLLWIIRKVKFFQNEIEKKITWQNFTPSQKLKFIALFLIIAGFSEIFLRLVFEYLIAYMHMHDWMKLLASPQAPVIP